MVGVPKQPEPPRVVEARSTLQKGKLRVAAFVGSCFAGTAAVVGAGMAEVPGPVFAGIFVVFIVGVLAGVPFLKEDEQAKADHVIKEWESRGLRQDFDRFDVPREADSRIEAAEGMAQRIRSLQSADVGTDTMVSRLEARLARLVSDELAASHAAEALVAAGAAGAAVDRLREVSDHLGDEAARILTGLSELYAALLEAESDVGSGPTEQLMAWLSAEAEIARAAQEAEALRPAGESRAAAKQARRESAEKA